MPLHTLIIGHSICKWLEHYLLAKKDLRLSADFNIKEMTTVAWHGISGRTVNQLIKCGFTVPRSKRKVLQNFCCQNCNNGTGNLKCNEFNTKHRQSCYYWWVKNIQNLWVLSSIHERRSYGQQDLLHVYTLKIYICSLNNLSVCLLLFVLLKTYKKAHKFNFQKSIWCFGSLHLLYFRHIGWLCLLVNNFDTLVDCVFW